MTWMYPGYAPLKNFDTEHTPFASKYKLYLYREQEYDKTLEVCLGEGGGGNWSCY